MNFIKVRGLPSSYNVASGSESDGHTILAPVCRASIVHPKTVRLIGCVAFAVCVSSAFFVCFHPTAVRTAGEPPPSRDATWRWVGASPGMNVYYAYRAHVVNNVVSIWFDRRFFSNPAGINKDLVEAWDVDCPQQRFRRVLRFNVSVTPSPGAHSTWSKPGSGTPQAHLLRLVCADIDSRDRP